MRDPRRRGEHVTSATKNTNGFHKLIWKTQQPEASPANRTRCPPLQPRFHTPSTSHSSPPFRHHGKFNSTNDDWCYIVLCTRRFNKKSLSILGQNLRGCCVAFDRRELPNGNRARDCSDHRDPLDLRTRVFCSGIRRTIF